MESPVASDSPQPLNNGYYVQSPEEAQQWMQQWLLWGLLLGGLLLVLFSVPIARLLVAERVVSGIFSTDPEKAREWALTLRFLGAMSFAAGLVERVVIEIGKLKAGAGSG